MGGRHDVAGFLPPNVPPQTRISNRARIVFDSNAPIDRADLFNVIDATR